MADESLPANQYGIVLASFGSIEPGAQAVYDRIATATRQRFPNGRVTSAFTSGFVRRRHRSAGCVVMDAREAVDKLLANGCKTVVLQSLHIAPGEEFAKLLEVRNAFTEVRIGAPLLSSSEDIALASKAIMPYFLLDGPNVVVAHGNDSHPELNASITAFADHVEAAYTNTYVGSLHGSPGDGCLDAASESARQAGHARIVPFMLVAGNHVREDLMSDTPDSWKTRLGVSDVSCAIPLGMNLDIVEIFFCHIRNALNGLIE